MTSFLKHFRDAQTRLLSIGPRAREAVTPRRILSGHRAPGPWRTAAALLAGMLLSLSVAAQLIENRVTALNPLDRQYMDVQRELLNELTLRHYGGRCCRNQTELDYLQRLLDDGHVKAEQTRELQAMGVALGDLLARELDMQWVVYEDIKGRSRALRLGESENYLFPVTMIARRVEGGDRTPVVEIYQQAYEAIEAVRPPLPFQ